MHTLIICRHHGYSTFYGGFAECQSRFLVACEDKETIVAAWYNQHGDNVNSYANPETFTR